MKLAQTPTCCSSPESSNRPEQQRSDGGAFALLVPAESGDDAVAFALVLHLQHDALVGLVGAGVRLGDDAVEARAFEAAKPVGGDGAVASRGRQM